jgi:hypothetical protein
MNNQIFKELYDQFDRQHTWALKVSAILADMGEDFKELAGDNHERKETEKTQLV